MSVRYATDFETTTKLDDCRVWAYGICEVGKPKNFVAGNNIEGFIEWTKNADNPICYFHNLQFDGDFLIKWYLRNGFTHVEDKRDLRDNTFTTLITDSGMFYTMTVCYSRGNKKIQKVEYRDSMKIIPGKVRQIAKDFGLPIAKGEIDYHKERPIGYKLTVEELDYLYNDCAIMAMALEQLFNSGLDKLTTGSNALKDYKDMAGKNFKYWFPEIDEDNDNYIRKAYKGGFTYADSRFLDTVIHRFNVFDVNSLYPYIMYNRMLPYGKPLSFKGKYKPNKEYPLYIQHVIFSFDIKPRKIPTIQIKNNSMYFLPTQYLETSGAEEVELWLTNIDLKLIKEHYNLYNIEYIDGFMFRATNEMFKNYVRKWTDVKIKSKEKNDKSNYTIAKLMMNSLYGKFGMRGTVKNKIPVYIEETDEVKYVTTESKKRKTLYIPVAVFITSWARDYTIRAAQANYNNFTYADTDSLHLIGRAIPKNLEINPTLLGKWSHELVGYKAKYLGQKAYLEYGCEPNDFKKHVFNDSKGHHHRVKKLVTVAGMPDSCYKHVTLDNFNIGTEYEGKRQAKRVKTGTVIIDTTFRFRKRLKSHV